MVKKCTKCYTEKPVSDFYYENGRHRADCKACKRETSMRGNTIKPGYDCPNNAVYGIFDADGLCYIGSSKSTSRRLYLHFESKGSTHHQFMSDMAPIKRKMAYRWKVLWHGDSLEDRERTEKLLIKALEPKFNKIKYKHYNG